MLSNYKVDDYFEKSKKELTIKLNKIIKTILTEFSTKNKNLSGDKLKKIKYNYFSTIQDNINKEVKTFSAKVLNTLIKKIQSEESNKNLQKISIEITKDAWNSEVLKIIFNIISKLRKNGFLSKKEFEKLSKNNSSILNKSIQKIKKLETLKKKYIRKSDNSNSVKEKFEFNKDKDFISLYNYILNETNNEKIN